MGPRWKCIAIHHLWLQDPLGCWNLWKNERELCIRMMAKCNLIFIEYFYLLPEHVQKVNGNRCDNSRYQAENDKECEGGGSWLGGEAESVCHQDSPESKHKVEQEKWAGCSVCWENGPLIQTVEGSRENDGNTKEEEKVPCQVGKPECNRVDPGHDLDLKYFLCGANIISNIL